MSSPSIRTGYVRTGRMAGSWVAFPVRTSNFAPWKTHSISPSSTRAVRERVVLVRAVVLEGEDLVLPAHEDHLVPRPEAARTQPFSVALGEGRHPNPGAVGGPGDPGLRLPAHPCCSRVSMIRVTFSTTPPRGRRESTSPRKPSTTRRSAWVLESPRLIR
jgi:hypothetical protein